MEANVKYIYLQDPQNSRRRVTVARSVNLDDDEVTFAYAVNKPPVPGYNSARKRNAWVNGDFFNKRLGREISSGRLKKNNGGAFTVPLGEEKPVRRVIRALAELEAAPQCVRRIAQSYLAN